LKDMPVFTEAEPAAAPAAEAAPIAVEEPTVASSRRRCWKHAAKGKKKPAAKKKCEVLRRKA
jgi:hypothetical protein